MASIANDRNGTRRVLFVDGDGTRKTIRLGRVDKRTAEGIRRHVETLLAAKIAAQPLPRETAVWLAEIGDTLRTKLAAVGLIEGRPTWTLGAFIRDYVRSRIDAKPGTVEVWRQGEMGLLEYFGPEKALGDVTPGDADAYKMHLLAKGLAPMTVRKRLQFATMVFRAAVRRRLIAENPFTGVSVKAIMPDRGRFVTREETARLLDACPNCHWRAIVALARYGGLRTPSETLSLRWQDINWETSRVVVTSPKTEHHPGKATRVIPLFPELRPILEECFELAPEGAVYVVDERMRASAQGPTGWRGCNLRSTFERIVKRAGLTPWPKLFHALRSSRETELAKEYPLHVITAWLGHTPTIALRHYLQTTDADFERAIKAPTESGAKSGARSAQKAAQQAHAPNRTELHDRTQVQDW